MQFVIREFRETDRLQLRKLYVDVRYDTFEWLRKDNFIKDSFDADTDGELIFVAEHEGKPVGFISLWLPDRFVHHLYVDCTFQRRGIGSALLKTAVEAIGYPLRLKCLQINTKGSAFYTKSGWKTKSEGFSAEGFFTLFELEAPHHSEAAL